VSAIKKSVSFSQTLSKEILVSELNREFEVFPRLKSHGLISYTVNEFCHLIGISRSTFYELLKEGKLRTVMIRGRRLVPASEAQKLMDEGHICYPKFVESTVK